MNCRICGKECTPKVAEVSVGDDWSRRIVSGEVQVCYGCVPKLIERFSAIIVEFNPETPPEGQGSLDSRISTTVETLPGGQLNGQPSSPG